MSTQDKQFYILFMRCLVIIVHYSNKEKLFIPCADSFLKTSLQGFWNSFSSQIVFKQPICCVVWLYGGISTTKQNLNSVFSDRKHNALNTWPFRTVNAMPQMLHWYGISLPGLCHKKCIELYIQPQINIVSSINTNQ